MPAITRLAILNRGESAKRALDAAAELGADEGTRITSIIVRTEADADAWFVGLADEAVSLGPATFTDPVDGRRKAAYLDEERVIAALKRADSDAVWVGWGFVAEHAGFARRCEQEDIAFVGPDSQTIALLGDKLAARRLAIKAGVPVVPGATSDVAGVADAAEQAARIGYPVVLKAAAGGGGRGIRVVRQPEALAEALDAARAEATLAFGDPTLFIERLVPQARHVEVQIIADDYGNVWALGVRDCTVQRRHQKVIEESASPALDAEAERAIKQDAILMCQAAGYRNAGTVEFLVDTQSGRHYFLEVNTRLQVEHPVTERTTGVDLVKLQLHVARGGRLEGEPPPAHGHAVEARLCAEDPERGFAAAPGRIELWRPPGGPGIRVDSGIVEGDEVVPDFDSMIAKVVAWGRDREEALARLRRALDQTAVVVAGGTTNRLFLRSLLDRPELRAGAVDNLWLDGLVAEGGHLAAPEPMAVIQAGIEAYDIDHAARAAVFHAAAARGRPERSGDVGQRVRLRYRGRMYALEVFRTGPHAYRVAVGDDVVDVEVERQGPYERRVRCAAVTWRLVCVTQGSSFLVDAGGATHRVYREDGGLVRAEFPAYVAAVRVAAGDKVAEGDPLLVLESMKMEATLTAPFSGQVTGVDVVAGSQVTTGAPLLRIREKAAPSTARTGGLADFAALASTDETDTWDCAAVYGALHRYLLGFDLDEAAVRRVVAAQRELAVTLPADDAALLRAEEEFLDLFADVSGLYRPQPEAHDGNSSEAGQDASAHEYLLSYLQWLDPERADLPPRFIARLKRALARYGVHSLERSPQLEEAVFWLYSSVLRADLLAPTAAAVLERRLSRHDALAHAAGPGLRSLLDRLAAAAQSRHPVVADLARDVRFRYFDEPLLERSLAGFYQEMDEHLDALEAEASGDDRVRRIERLVRCPQPLRGRLLLRSVKAAGSFRKALLEVYIRRFYSTRSLTSVSFDERDDMVLATADFEHEGERFHLVAGFVELDDLHQAAAAVAHHLAGRPGADGEVVVDLSTWRSGLRPSADAMAARIADALGDCDFGRCPRRVEVTVTSENGDAPEYRRTQHFSFRPRGDGAPGFEEDTLHRNLHPMIAERIELWRLANFEVQRLPSVEDVFLFRCTARENAGDVRLFAIAEVRDLTAVRDESGRVVSLPRLERMGLQALAAMRQAMVGLDPGRRPQNNRIVLYVRPPFDVPRELWRELARPFAPLAVGVGLEKVVMRVRIPQGDRLRDAVLHLEGVGGEEVLVREFPVGDAPVSPLTQYRQKVLRAQRIGVPYPYEIIRMISPQAGTRSAFPRGGFAEYDLDDNDELSPVERPPGANSANVVVGLVTNYTAKVPEGMTRAAILGDPTRGMGALAEPECRRILAALRLAARLRVPVEWFAVSSGARIAMDSGTENMDWIAAVLRGLIEFTQAGGEVNVVVTGINVGAQPYWNAEATMLMHTRGILIMVRTGAMVLTGKQALDFSGGVSAEDNLGVGGLEHIMGPNGQAQYGARTVTEACGILLRHYEHCYVVPGERFPRRRPTTDPADRDVRLAPHHPADGSDFTLVGEVFSADRNPERKNPFDTRSVLRAVVDADAEPLERWRRWRDAETAIVWDAHIGGIPVCLLGLESHALTRHGFVPADGPPAWTAGTLFPQSSRKIARAVNAASGNRPLVVLANLSGFDGSPESMRRWQLEYGAEIGRAVTNFRGPIVFVVISRYHGGAFVVFSKRLNPSLEIAALDGSFASVIGGAPAAAVVFAREVDARTERDPRVAGASRTRLQEVRRRVRAEKLGEVAAEFDGVHTIERALRVGSVDRIIPASGLRPYLIDALERGMAREGEPR
ncbi:MAG TPA: carboxyl transferase domain-containing protein [Actinocrinis sp.]|uniref:ATP-binding protein n=1 Tax=Actinocrinis sp. TaxID=1920516 RepID=UPI002D551E9E|nr:carboxyl transferase domain-containing protein [Actinocrinis sp.]HZU54911.1 carboxyl transferase domain-containing protein [Actinocrinis sp.]